MISSFPSLHIQHNIAISITYKIPTLFLYSLAKDPANPHHHIRLPRSIPLPIPTNQEIQKGYESSRSRWRIGLHSQDAVTERIRSIKGIQVSSLLTVIVRGCIAHVTVILSYTRMLLIESKGVQLNIPTQQESNAQSVTGTL
jgi:hypothetical protein